MNPAEPLTLDTPFRCTQFSCLLTVKACLRRQQETRRKAGKGGADHRVPVHPHCAGGTCEQGNVHRGAFPDFQHEQPDPRQAPRLDLVTQETSMPAGKPKTPHTCCGSRGTRHLDSCTEWKKRSGLASPARGPRLSTLARPPPHSHAGEGLRRHEGDRG